MPQTTALKECIGITCFFALSVTQACLQASDPEGGSERRSAGLQECRNARRRSASQAGIPDGMKAIRQLFQRAGRQASHRSCLFESRNDGTADLTNDGKSDRRHCIKTAGQYAGMTALFHAGWQAVHGNRNLKTE